MPLNDYTPNRLSAFFGRRPIGSLSTGMVVTMCAGLLLPALFGGLLLTSLAQRHLNSALETQLNSKVELLAKSLLDPIWNVNFKTVNSIAQAAMLDPQVVRITVNDPSKIMILAVEKPERRLGNSRVLMRELVLNSEPVGFIEVEIDDGLKQEELKTDRRTYFLALLGQFVFALVLILFTLRRRVLKPLSRLIDFSNQLASGDLDHSLDWKQPDEIGHLAEQLDQMRSALRNSFAEQQAILKNVQVGVVFIRERVIQLVNRHAEHIFGYQPGEMHGHLSREIFLSDEQFVEVGTRAYAAIASPGGSYEDELRLKRHDGEAFWARMRGCALDLRASQAGSIWVFEDITEQRRISEQLRLAALVFENTTDGVIITDRDQQIVAVNRGFEQITGYPEKEVLGKKPSLLKSNRHDREFFKGMWRTLNESHYWDGEIWNRRKNGDVYPEQLTISAVFDAVGDLNHYVGVFSDITYKKAAEDEIKHLAFYDILTRLPNRRLMLDRLAQALTSSARHKRHCALMMIDLDNFKTLNDTQGHDIGDQLLVAVALRLETCVRKGDTVARLGGDEFVIILEDLGNNEEAALHAEGVARKVLAQLSKPYLLDIALNGVKLSPHRHQCTSSIGITLFDEQPISVDEIMKRADTAMYQAKSAGRNTLRFYDPEMQSAVADRAAMESDLHRAIEHQQFVLYYQAQVDSSDRVIGAEALLRWNHPERGLVSPADFIPITEATGLILPIGQWVLQTACDLLATWSAYEKMAHLTVSVNVSARQFHHPDFVSQVVEAISRSSANPERLKLELTESLLVDDIDDVIEKMSALKAKGVCFSLDDFGTGYSSLSYLKLLPLDQLKIDQGFVRDVLSDSNDAAIARTILALGNSLGLGVIAEGVETEAQRDFLASSGCSAYQGYYFCRPLPLEKFEAYMRERS